MQEICFYVDFIYLWNAFKKIVIGPWCVLMNVQVYDVHGEEFEKMYTD
jgi:hypothetical protein